MSQLIPAVVLQCPCCEAPKEFLLKTRTGRAPPRPRGVTSGLPQALTLVIPGAGLDFACREESRAILWGPYLAGVSPPIFVHIQE